MGAATLGLGSLGLNGRVTEKSTNYVEYIRRCLIVFFNPLKRLYGGCGFRCYVFGVYVSHLSFSHILVNLMF